MSALLKKKPVSELVPGTALKDGDLCFGLMDNLVAYGGNTLARIYRESEEVIGLWMEARANRGDGRRNQRRCIGGG